MCIAPITLVQPNVMYITQRALPSNERGLHPRFSA
jgi:hypothetical protein